MENDQVQSNIMGVSAVAGPGSIENRGEAPKPLLEGATEFEYVEVLNPLAVDFAPQFATTTPIKAPLSIGQNQAGIKEEDIRREGIDLRNPDYEANGRSATHVVTNSIIKAGQTRRFPGDKAQIVVRQLVTEIMQREGKRLQLWDPFARNQVEQRVIRTRGSIQEMMDNAPIKTVAEQIDQVFNKPEQEFPEVTNETTEFTGSNSPVAETSGDSGNESVLHQRRAPGRPKRTE